LQVRLFARFAGSRPKFGLSTAIGAKDQHFRIKIIKNQFVDYKPFAKEPLFCNPGKPGKFGA
jgi:hypothetical protein